MRLLLLSIGGAFGAILRYLLGLIIMKKLSYSPIPIAMLMVNYIGSLGLGIFFGSLLQITLPEVHILYHLDELDHAVNRVAVRKQDKD